jgi:histidyl-tRNA synthetase
MDRLPGFRDFYPAPAPTADGWTADARQYLFDNWREVARRYGFREYDGPPLEPLELFTTKSGDEIVGQLYNFNDKGERAVALRPEMTPTLARMVAAAERHYRKPMKWFALPQLFRYERQQKGRLREHFQFNADIFGESSPGADAELIALLIDSLRSLKLTAADFRIRLSSRNAWHEYFVQHCPVTDREYDFYQVIDKLEREAPENSEAKLRALGFSLEEVRGFIQAAQPTAELARILDDLAARGLADFVTIDYGVIRGLAYYTGPVFEAFDCSGAFRAIAGGGRYDQLVKLISGGRVDLPGLGFGMGDVVLTELLRARKLLPGFEPRIDLFCLIENENLRLDSLTLVHQLREAGLIVEFPLAPTKSDKQFKRALELKAAHTLRLEAMPDATRTVLVKNLETREEFRCAAADAVARLVQHRREHPREPTR